MTKEQKAPRGRPPVGAILVDGQWQLTPESLERTAARLEKHRTDCRERYRRNRTALARQRPELFKYRLKTWTHEMLQRDAQTTLQNAEPAEETR